MADVGLLTLAGLGISLRLCHGIEWNHIAAITTRQVRMVHYSFALCVLHKHDAYANIPPDAHKGCTYHAAC